MRFASVAYVDKMTWNDVASAFGTATFPTPPPGVMDFADDEVSGRGVREV